MHVLRNHIILLAILVIGITLRLYNIYDFAVFKGDQGRDAMIILEHVRERVIPLHGPRTSTGQFPGPFFFYLIGVPFVLFNFNPMAPTIYITILEALTIIPLYMLISRFSKSHIAAGVTLIYALAPEVIAQSRQFWNPTTIPLFTALLFLAMYDYVKVPSRKLLFIIAIILGIIIQLHASAYAYIPATVLVILFMYGRKPVKPSLKNIVISILIFLLGICIPLSPYIWFEATHNFRDIIELFVVGTNVGTILSWPIPTHYYSFILIVPFIVTGVILTRIETYLGKITTLGIITISAIICLVRLPSVMTPTYDIEQTTWAVNTIETTTNNPFAFVQVAGSSASDLHYRFYLSATAPRVEPMIK